MPSTTVTLTFKKATKNTYVFENPDASVSTIYVDKSAFTTQPSSITITITPN